MGERTTLTDRSGTMVKPITGVAIVLVVVLVAGAVGRGNWAHHVISLSLGLWVGIPLLVTGIVLFVRRRVDGAMFCLGTCGILLLQFAVGIGFLHWDLFRGQQYCESLVPILDDIYNVEGRYPLVLQGNSRLPPPSSWQFDTSLINYNSDGETFSFEVTNPAVLFGGFVYRHDKRVWEEWVD